MAGGISPAPRLVGIPRRLRERGHGHPLSPAVGDFGGPRPPEGDTSHCGGLGRAQDPSPAAGPRSCRLQGERGGGLVPGAGAVPARPVWVWGCWLVLGAAAEQELSCDPRPSELHGPALPCKREGLLGA